MISPALLLTLPAALCVPDSEPPALQPVHSPAMQVAVPASDSLAPASDTLEVVFEGGQSWEAFQAGVDAREALWERNWAEAEVAPELVERARATGGPWKVLVIAVASCSDSVSTVPYLARLVEALDSVELRIVDSDVGRPWMEAHRSPDGRATTPTILVLDDEYRVRGCWVEQPAALQSWWLDVLARGDQAEEFDRKMAWYEEEAGRETLREFVEVLEAAGGDEPICPGL